MKTKNKVPSQKQKDRVTALVIGLEGMFQVGNHDLGFIWRETDDEEIPTSASIEINEPYQRLTITIYPIFWTHKLERQRRTILHEMCHVATYPMASVIRNLLDGKLETEEHYRRAHEKSTSTMAEMLDAVMTGGYKKKKKAYEAYLKK